MAVEAVALVDFDKAGIGQENRLVAELLHGLRDADRVERRAEGGLGEKCDGFLAHGISSLPNILKFNPSECARARGASCTRPSARCQIRDGLIACRNPDRDRARSCPATSTRRFMS